jgi:thiol-disulfide isomerase/thioredoxin
MESETTSPNPVSKRHVLAVAAAALAAGASFHWWRHSATPINDPSLQALWSSSFDQPDGSPLQLADFKGKPLVLNFWATWCTPCVEEMPLLNAFFQENRLKSWQMIGLAIDQPSAVKRFLSQHPVEYAIGMAGLNGTELMKNLGNEAGGLPFTLVINAQGAVQMRKLGKLTDNDIRSWV